MIHFIMMQTIMSLLLQVSWISATDVTLFMLIVISAVVNTKQNINIKKCIEGLRDQQDDSKWKEENSYSLSIDNILEDIRLELRCADVYLGRFHDGGTFVDGSHMRKFSITHEKIDEVQQEMVRSYFFDKFRSHWATVFNDLYATKEFWCPRISETKHTVFKKDMARFGFKTTFIYLISQADQMKAPVGFIAVNWRDEHIVENAKEERDRVVSDIPRLLSLMNLIPIKK